MFSVHPRCWFGHKREVGVNETRSRGNKERDKYLAIWKQYLNYFIQDTIWTLNRIQLEAIFQAIYKQGMETNRTIGFSVSIPVRTFPFLSLFAGFCSLPPRLIVNLSSRKIPGLNVYAQMQNEKEQEMISPASPTEVAPNSQRDVATSSVFLDTELSTRPIGDYR